MVCADLVTARGVDGERYAIAHINRARFNLRLMRVKASERFRRVVHQRAQTRVIGDQPRIAHLPAALAIKRRLVGDDRHVGRSLRVQNFDPIDENSEHFANAFGRCISGKFGRSDPLGNVEPDVVRCLRPRTLPRRARHRFLPRHPVIETGTVNAQTLRAQSILGQVIGKTISVVELERDITRQGRARRHPRCCFIEQFQPILQRPPELRFLLKQCRLNRCLRADQFGKRPAHFGHQRRHEPMHQRILRAQDMRMPHRPPHDPAQHVSPPLV